jgi:hypothetical protein
MPDFPVGYININGGSLDWGPFDFDFTASIPPGDSLSSVAVTSMLGLTDTTSSLIAGSPSFSGTVVSVRLSFPGAQYLGQHLLQFELTFASGGMNRFQFLWVNVVA